MKSNSETGHNKNVTTFETLIITCEGFGNDYNPSNEDLTIANLKTKHNNAKKSVKDVKTTEATFNEVEGQRKLMFKPLKTTSTKVLNALKSSKAPTTAIDDAETINRKIQGKRADNAVTETPEGEKAKDKNSVSQQSFDMQIDHFEKLIELVDLEPKYNPNELPIKVDTLKTYQVQLDTINTDVKNTYTTYKNALDSRNATLYTSESGLVDIAKAVKNYAKSVFGTSSPQYKQISKLAFKTVK
jgi:hypothetical protein